MIKDKSSPEWLAVKAHCEQRLTDLRAENDGDVDELGTAKIRGMIAFAKEVLELGAEEKQPDVRDVRYID